MDYNSCPQVKMTARQRQYCSKKFWSQLRLGYIDIDVSLIPRPCAIVQLWLGIKRRDRHRKKCLDRWYKKIYPYRHIIDEYCERKTQEEKKSFFDMSYDDVDLTEEEGKEFESLLSKQEDQQKIMQFYSSPPFKWSEDSIKELYKQGKQNENY